jgi:hypothetical protein
LLFGAMLNAAPSHFLNAAEVRLPGGARFLSNEAE